MAYVQEEQEHVSGTEAMDIQQENGDWEEMMSPSVPSVPHGWPGNYTLDLSCCAADPVTREENTNPVKKNFFKGGAQCSGYYGRQWGLSKISVKSFEDILECGKTMVLTSVGDDINIDIDILTPCKQLEVTWMDGQRKPEVRVLLQLFCERNCKLINKRLSVGKDTKVSVPDAKDLIAADCYNNNNNNHFILLKINRKYSSIK